MTLLTKHSQIQDLIHNHAHDQIIKSRIEVWHGQTLNTKHGRKQDNSKLIKTKEKQWCFSSVRLYFFNWIMRSQWSFTLILPTNSPDPTNQLSVFVLATFPLIPCQVVYCAFHVVPFQHFSLVFACLLLDFTFCTGPVLQLRVFRVAWWPQVQLWVFVVAEWFTSLPGWTIMVIYAGSLISSWEGEQQVNTLTQESLFAHSGTEQHGDII